MKKVKKGNNIPLKNIYYMKKKRIKKPINGLSSSVLYAIIQHKTINQKNSLLI